MLTRLKSRGVILQRALTLLLCASVLGLLLYAPVTVLADTVNQVGGGSATPVGAAGGDLAGTYPNPTIGTGTIAGTRTWSGATTYSAAGTALTVTNTAKAGQLNTGTINNAAGTTTIITDVGDGSWRLVGLGAAGSATTAWHITACAACSNGSNDIIDVEATSAGAVLASIGVGGKISGLGVSPQVSVGAVGGSSGGAILFVGATSGSNSLQVPATAGTGIVTILPTVATTFPTGQPGANGGYLTATTAGVQSYGTTEHDFSAYNAANLAAGTAFAQTIVTNASTLTSASNLTLDVVGVGAATFVAKLCSDGVTCAGGNVYLTCTAPANWCNAGSPGVTQGCTLTKSAVAAATTLTWSVTTACATTDPGFNAVAHMTTP